jgi:hypothetical protein
VDRGSEDNGFENEFGSGCEFGFENENENAS